MQHRYASSDSNAPNPLTMAKVVDRLPPTLHYRAFPVRPFTKKPEVERWQIARTTCRGQKNLLKNYVSRFPNSSVGLRLGWDCVTRTHLAVIDVDDLDQLSQYEIGFIEEWPWVVHGHRGPHAYGIPRDEEAQDETKNYLWGQFLFERAFVMAPGTLHPSGDLYTPVSTFGFEPVPVFPPQFLADLRDATRIASPPTRSTPGETIGKRDTIGSPNPLLFDLLRLWAYRQPRPSTQEAWRQIIEDKGLEMAVDMPDRSGIDDKAVAGMAYRIAIFTWEHRSSSPFATTDSDVQKERNAQSIASRQKKVALRNSRILALRDQGLSYRAIADAISEEMEDVSKSTVERVVKQARALE